MSAQGLTFDRKLEGVSVKVEAWVCGQTTEMGSAYAHSQQTVSRCTLVGQKGGTSQTSEKCDRLGGQNKTAVIDSVKRMSIDWVTFRRRAESPLQCR
eukprot:1270735-Rhodomonas_salina.1